MDIPVIPGVSVTPMGILNKPLKDIICALLFGGLDNLLKGNLLCVNLDLEQLLGMPGLTQELQADLLALKNELKAMEQMAGVPNMLGMINGAIAEVQNLLALDGLCKIPLKAPLIPDVLSQTIDAEYAQANGILNDIGRLDKPKLCLNGKGGFNTGTYNANSIMARIKAQLNNMANIPQYELNILRNRIQAATVALRASVNRQLFPDFRHKHDLTTGQHYSSSSTSGTGASRSSSAIILASSTEHAKLIANINSSSSDPINLKAWQKITGLPSTATVNDVLATYPPANTTNLKDTMTTAQTLVSSVKNTASYPVVVNGIKHENIWPGLLGPSVYALAVQALTPQDPLFVQQDPVYDYCGKLIGYTSTVISGDPTARGGNPQANADLNPPKTNFNFVWISDRQCWAVTGIQSQQVVNGKKDTYLDANPTIELHRGYNHILGIPSADINGFVLQPDGIHPTNASMAPEFYICRVGTNLKPLLSNGHIVPFNMGLSRLETSELLENANGIIGQDAVDGPDGYQRRLDNPFGTTMYFSIDQAQYSGTIAPISPDPSVWWYNPVTCVAQRWVSDGADGGSWIVVSDSDRLNNWYGSSIIHTDPSVNYLAYSNKDGSVFGLLKLV